MIGLRVHYEKRTILCMYFTHRSYFKLNSFQYIKFAVLFLSLLYYWFVTHINKFETMLRIYKIMKNLFNVVLHLFLFFCTFRFNSNVCLHKQLMYRMIFFLFASAVLSMESDCRYSHMILFSRQVIYIMRVYVLHIEH